MLETQKVDTVLTMEQSVYDTDNQQERLTDLAWLAGLWEGEGCFGLFSHSRNRIYPAATIVNSDFELIEQIHAVLNKYKIGHNIQFRNLSSKNPKHKDTKTIFVVGMKRIKNLISSILPFIRGRKSEVCKVILEYVEYRLSLPQNRKISSTDFTYRERVMALNKKGPVESSETKRWTDTLSEDIVQAV